MMTSPQPRRALAASLAVIALGAAACGSDDSSSSGAANDATTTAPSDVDNDGTAADDTTGDTTAGDTTDETSGDDTAGRCGDPSKIGDSLNFYNWADYIDTAVLEQFEAECGVAVTMDTYASNEELLAKLQAGNTGYSLTIPTDYNAQLIIEAGLAHELDMALLPNASNLDPLQMAQYYDPDNLYTLPYLYSTTGIAYNASVFDEPPTSWAALFDENEHCGQSSLLDDQNETVGAALVYSGFDWSSNDPDGHAQAKELLLNARDCISAFDSTNFIGNLASGEVVIAQSWGFAAAIARIDNPDIQFIIPEEGGILWQDNFLIPSDAPDPYTAHVFINYMLDAEIGAQITEFTLGFTPNLEAAKLLSDDYHALIDDGGVALTDDVRARLEPSVHGDQVLFADTWNAIITAS